jgi:small subunit ribosomal protein SAe
MASAAARVLSQKEQDIQMMLAADVHLGTKNCDFQMERYVFKRRSDGNFLIRVDRGGVLRTVLFLSLWFSYILPDL